MTLPAGLTPASGPGASGFSADEARPWVERTLRAGLRLRDAAAADPGRTELRGRGVVWVVPAETGRWVVRPYRRGGAVAGPLLGDRYLRVGQTRPLAEARASAEALERGVPTPRVLAGAVYHAGPFYRADLVTEYIAGSRDLAGVLFGELARDPKTRAGALRAAGLLLRSMAAAGVEHPDLNAHNILLLHRGNEQVAMLIDLDRCTVKREGSPAASAPMLARLERSLRKLEGRSGLALAAGEVGLLRQVVSVAP